MIPARLFTLCLMLQGLAAQAPAPADLLPRADPAVQAQIREMIEAKSEAEQRRALEALRASAGPGHARLVPQLFLLLHGAKDTREAMAAGFVIRALPIPPEHVVRGLVPLLESEDPALFAEVGNALAEFEHRTDERGANFAVYRALLAQGAGAGCLRHLFATDPGAALLELAHLEVTDSSELRALLLAEHEVTGELWKLERGYVRAAEPGALAELATLARHPRWWARLYAVEVARRSSALRAAVPLSELRDDAHARARAAAAR